MSVENGVKRPTGGGIVYHQTSDLSFSLVWPRGLGLLPEKPRACYEAIHQKIKMALEKWNASFTLNLFVSCEASPRIQNKQSVCFQEPVCNDIMLRGQKLVGGALRITKQAILYQGNILLAEADDLETLKDAIAAEF